MTQRSSLAGTPRENSLDCFQASGRFETSTQRPRTSSRRSVARETHESRKDADSRQTCLPLEDASLPLCQGSRGPQKRPKKEENDQPVIQSQINRGSECEGDVRKTQG